MERKRTGIPAGMLPDAYAESSLLPSSPGRQPAGEAAAAPHRAYLAAKRTIDLIVGLLLLVVVLPLLLLTMLVIRLTSAGPALISQDRVGLHGRTFRMLKFRTMVRDAHTMREAVLGDPDEGIFDRYREDPRITPVGRVLRRWSLDELPQLVNVVGGQMSLVGPRPILPDEVGHLRGEDLRRHELRPGITGLWQVRGRKKVNWDDRMRLDLQYIDECSPKLDTLIVGRTLRAVVTGEGAY